MGYALLYIVVIAFFGFLFYMTFGRVLKSRQNIKRLAQEGDLALATVMEVGQTGTTVNQVPEMRLLLKIENVGSQPRQVEIKQLIDLGAIPRAGDRVYVLIDKADPNNVVLSPMPTGKWSQVNLTDGEGHAAGTADLGSDQVKDFMSLSPALRERGKIGVGIIAAVEPGSGGDMQVTFDIDNIGQPRKRVTVMQRIEGFAPPVGARVYFLYDPQDPDQLALAPASMTGGQTLGVGSNRLDPLVLGPQLLELGAKAQGEVKEVQSVPLVNSFLGDKGFSKWALIIQVTPLTPAVAPYEAHLTISLTTPEKAARIAKIGALVPLRYDPLDLQTISIDSLAMGFPNPYEDVMKAFADKMRSNAGA